MKTEFKEYLENIKGFKFIIVCIIGLILGTMGANKWFHTEFASASDARQIQHNASSNTLQIQINNLSNKMFALRIKYSEIGDPSAPIESKLKGDTLVLWNEWKADLDKYQSQLDILLKKESK